MFVLFDVFIGSSMIQFLHDPFSEKLQYSWE